VKLTKRLEVIASYFSSCESMADIGTDHAYLPIYLAKQKEYAKLIATELNSGPLERARKEVQDVGVDSVIELRQGNGLACLKIGEVEAVAIAGMGGETIRDILQDALPLVKSLKLLVLQPMSRGTILREWLAEQGFLFLDEELVAEDNHLYEIIVVRLEEGGRDYSSLELEIGPILLEKRHPLLISQVERLLKRYEQVFLNLKGEKNEKYLSRIEEIRKKIEKLGEIVKWLKVKQ